MLKQRQQPITPLEKAVSGNDCNSIKNLLSQAKRVPMYLFELAASLEHTEAFDCLFKLLPASDQSLIITNPQTTKASLLGKQFKMFEHLVYTHKCYFTLNNLIEAYNKGVDEAITFYLSACCDIRFLSVTSDRYVMWYYSQVESQVGKRETGLFFYHLAMDLTRIDLSLMKLILDHPEFPVDRYKILLHLDCSSTQCIYSNLQLLQYVHTRFDLCHMFTSAESAEDIEDDLRDMPFKKAIQNGAYDCCEELIRIGIQPQCHMWNEVWNAPSKVNKLESYKYLYSINLPFYTEETKATFENIMAYTHACIDYMIFDDSSILDYFQSIKFPLCGESQLVEALPELVVEVYSELKMTNGMPTRVLFVSNSKVTYDVAFQRLTECCNLFTSFGCSWSTFNIYEDELNDVFSLSCVLQFVELSQDLLWKFLHSDYHNYLDIALYCLTNFNYRLSTDQLRQALGIIDRRCFEDDLLQPIEPSENDELVLLYWYNNQMFRYLMLELLSPICHMNHSPYLKCSCAKNITESCPGLVKHYTKNLKEIEAQCQAACQVFTQFELGLPYDVVLNVVCAYL